MGNSAVQRQRSHDSGTFVLLSEHPCLLMPAAAERSEAQGESGDKDSQMMHLCESLQAAGIGGKESGGSLISSPTCENRHYCSVVK